MLVNSFRVYKIYLLVLCSNFSCSWCTAYEDSVTGKPGYVLLLVSLHGQELMNKTNITTTAKNVRRPGGGGGGGGGT